MANTNMSIRTDSELKAQAEAVFPQLGSEKTVYADLLPAQSERSKGYRGRNARAVLNDMDQIIDEASCEL